MTETGAWGDPDPEHLRRVNESCDEFEDEWRAGRRPRIEDFLGRADEPGRRVLLRELLALEVHYRRKCGESPTPDEYLPRFPGDEEAVAAAFPGAGQAPTIDFPASDAAEPAAGPKPAPQPTIAGYEILGELGRGGMGVVYRARDLKLDRTVALKMILAGAHAGQEGLARLLVEARATARVRHPHIVHIQKIDEADELPYLELEFVGGGSLARQLDGKPRPPRDAARLVELLARAAAYAHERNIVHRDLKPGNVLLTEAGEPKIADFGLAKMTDSATGPTVSGAMAGTPAYMAPEQARGDAKGVGSGADVYALGVILFELLTGRVPFADENRAALLRKVERDQPPSPRSLCREVPRDLEAVCLMCLEKDPADRYPSAAALAEDLARYLAGKPLAHARLLGPVSRFWRRCRRNPVAAGLSALLACAVLGLVVFLGRDDSLDRVRRSGKLVVGVDPNGAPYSSKEGDKLVGIDVDLAHAVAKRLGVDVEHVQFSWAWPGMVKQLDDRKIDALITCVSITEERKQQVAFVEYAHDPFVFVARPDQSIKTPAHLEGREVVVQEGTAAHQVAKRLISEGVHLKIHTEMTVPDTFIAVRAQEGRVLLEHKRIARHHVTLPGTKLEVFSSNDIDPALADQRLGIAVRKDAEALRAAIEEAVGEMGRDGTLQAILDRWDRR